MLLNIIFNYDQRMTFNWIRIWCFFIIPSLLLVLGLGTYHYALTRNLFDPEQIDPLPYDEYSMTKTEHWSSRWDFQTEQNYNEVERQISSSQGNVLEVTRGREKYHIEYEYEVDRSIIESVSEVKEEADGSKYSGRYLLVKYHKFVEIVYFNLNQKDKENQFLSQVCLELPIESTDNVVYHQDDSNNIWIVTLSMNKIVFVQIYSCIEGRLIQEYRYSMKNNVFINHISKIIKVDSQCMDIQVTTYSLQTVNIRYCPDKDTIEETTVQKTNDVKYAEKKAEQWSSYTAVHKDTPQNQFYKIINHILAKLGIDYSFKVAIDLFPSPVENTYQHFDITVVDEQNNYFLTLAKNKSDTGITALDRFLINSKTPLFHNNQHYRADQVLEFIDKESSTGKNPLYQHKFLDFTLNQTKRSYYKAVYKTFPNYKTEFMAIGNKALIYWPEQPSDDKDYLAIRTKEGALISQKGDLKGIHKEMPPLYPEVQQRVDQKPLEIVPGIFQFHVKEQALVSRPVYFQRFKQFGKVELVSLFNGKPLLSHYIKNREGYRYTSSYLINNEWWVLEYNPEKKKSLAKKYELFAAAANPDKVHTLEVTYGQTDSPEHQSGDDDLATLMEQFALDHQNGYILLSVFKCIDQYYYFQYSDASGSVFGVARVHFQRVSNRRLRPGQTASGSFQKKVMVPPEYLATPKYSLKPFAVAVKNSPIFKHIELFTGKTAVLKQTWSDFCHSSGVGLRKLQPLQKFYYLPIKVYAQSSSCSKPDEGETVFALNLRNIIIQGKLNDNSIKSISKNMVYFILLWLPIYLVLACFCSNMCRGKKENTGKEEEKKEKSGKQKKQ